MIKQSCSCVLNLLSKETEKKFSRRKKNIYIFEVKYDFYIQVTLLFQQ
jgi:hypothetical protein